MSLKQLPIAYITNGAKPNALFKPHFFFIYIFLTLIFFFSFSKNKVNKQKKKKSKHTMERFIIDESQMLDALVNEVNMVDDSNNNVPALMFGIRTLSLFSSLTI